jgi:O-antigen/teichoic acid export membrane protein
MGSAFVALVIKIIGTLITLIGIRLLLDNVGIDGYGEFSVYLSSVMLIAGFAQFGIPQVLVKNVARYLHLEKHSLIRGAVFYAYSLTAIVAVALSALLFLGFPIVDEIESLDYVLLVLLSLVTVLIVTNRIRFSLTRAVGRGAISEIPELIIRPLVLYVAVIVIYQFTKDVVVASIVALFISVFSSALIGQLIYRVRYKDIVLPRKKEICIADWIPQITLGFVAASCLAIREHGGILIASNFLADNELGVFRVTQQIMRVAILGSMAVNLSQAPRIAKYWLTEDHEKIRKQLLHGFIFASVIPALLVVGACGLNLMFDVNPFSVLLGEESKELELYMFCLVIPGVVYVLTGPSTQILMVTNQERLLAVIATVHCMLYLVFATVGMMAFGLKGLIFSYVFINSFMHVVTAVTLYKVTAIYPSVVIFLNEYLPTKK